jgi:hypothetical protein
MKKPLFILLIILTTGSSLYAQTVVSNDYFNYLYVGVENPISILAQNVPDHNMTVTVNNGSLRKIDQGKYGLTVCSKEVNYVVLKIYNKQQLIDSFFFKLKSLPEPTVMISSREFKGTMGVRAEMENVPVNVPLFTRSFIVTIVKKNGDTIKIENIGNAYTNATSRAFTSLAVGDRVILSDFKVMVGCENAPRELSMVIDRIYSGKQPEIRH